MASGKSQTDAPCEAGSHYSPLVGLASQVPRHSIGPARPGLATRRTRHAVVTSRTAWAGWWDPIARGSRCGRSASGAGGWAGKHTRTEALIEHRHRSRGSATVQSRYRVTVIVPVNPAYCGKDGGWRAQW